MAQPPNPCSNAAPVQPVWSWWDCGAGGSAPIPAESTRSSLGREEFSRNLPLACAAHPSRSDSAPHCRSLRAGAQSRAGVRQSQGRTGDESELGAKSPALFFQKSSDFREKTPGAGTTLSLALPNPSPSPSLPGKASTAGQGAHNNFWTKHF